MARFSAWQPRKGKIMRIKISPLFIPILFFIGCAPQLASRQTIFRDEVTSLDALSTEDRDLLDRNWKTAEDLFEQDKMAWIASDSLLPKLTQQEMEPIRGYVVNGSLYNGEVFFFSEDKTQQISIVATVFFINGKFSNVTKSPVDIPSSVPKMAKCIQNAREINKDYITRQNVNYNTYSLVTDSGITIYMAPGSVNNYFILCGGILTEFDEDLNLKRNTELHKSIVVFESKKVGTILARSSSVTPVLNEIDILQYLVWKDVIYNQMIMTGNYSFFLYNIPDEQRIIKRVLTKKDLEKK